MLLQLAMAMGDRPGQVYRHSRLNSMDATSTLVYVYTDIHMYIYLTNIDGCKLVIYFINNLNVFA